MHRPPLRTTILASLLVASKVTGGTLQPISDPAYGGNGDGIARVPAALVPADEASGIRAIVQADGRLVLVGTSQKFVNQQYESQIVLMRLDAEGRLDGSFGLDHDGLVRIVFHGSVDDAAQTSDGKLVYSGHSFTSESMIVGRLNADGTPDTSFMGSGSRLISPSALLDAAATGVITTVLPQPDGKLLMIGFVNAPAQRFSCAARLLADGSMDTNFGNAGRTCIAPPQTSGAQSMALTGHLLADGSILVAGASEHPGGSNLDMSVARLDANGMLDTSFGPAHDGWAFVGFDQGMVLNDVAGAITVDGQGRILLAGYYEFTYGDGLGIARLLPNGQLDLSFGGSGRVQAVIDPDDSYAEAFTHSIAMLPDGDILVGSNIHSLSYSGSAAFRFEDDGQLDPQFGDNGIFRQASVASGTSPIVSNQQFLVGDYLYMVGGVRKDSSHPDFAATRFVLPLFADGFDD